MPAENAGFAGPGRILFIFLFGQAPGTPLFRGAGGGKRPPKGRRRDPYSYYSLLLFIFSPNTTNYGGVSVGNITLFG